MKKRLIWFNVHTKVVKKLQYNGQQKKLECLTFAVQTPRHQHGK